MNRYGTSLREQEIFYFVQNFFPDAVSGYKIKSKGKVIEVDIFIPSLKLVIEYDGGHWHKNKVDTDNRKNSIIILKRYWKISKFIFPRKYLNGGGELYEKTINT